MKKKILQFLLPLIFVCLVSINTFSATGGPDTYGYTFIDSNEPAGPTYNFEDISGSGTQVGLADDETSNAIPIGFNFGFYGNFYSDIYVCSNGFITFTDGQPSPYVSDPIPDPDSPNNLIAGWWEDLNPPRAGGRVDYEILGTSPNRRFIIQFSNVRHYWNSNPVTFQFKLFESTNEIEIHYEDCPSDGGVHSVGIENANGTIGLQYFRDTADITPPTLAVRFIPPPPTDMAYDSSTVTQNSDNVVAGTFDQQIIGIEIVTSGDQNPLSVTQFSLNTNGTTDIGDIYNARVYYTGTNSTFSTSNQFGAIVVNPNGNFSITGSQTLSLGFNITHYFWLTYDIEPGALLGNFVDAECSQITISGSDYTPSPTAPGGARQIDNISCPSNGTFDSGSTGWTSNIAGDGTITYPGNTLQVVGSNDGTQGATYASQAGINIGGTTLLFDLLSYNSTDVDDWDYPVFILDGTNYRLNTNGTVSLGVTGSTINNANQISSPVSFEVDLDALAGSGVHTIGFGVYSEDGIQGSGEAIFDNIECAPMEYSTSTVTQNTDPLLAGRNKQQIIGIEIVSENYISPISVTQFNFNTNGTTDISDISNARVYYTGVRSVFDTLNFFGSEASLGVSFNITGSQTLAHGTNYFWLTFDIDSGTTTGNHIDAECTQITVDGTDYVPTITAPAGDREVVIPDPFPGTMLDFDGENDYVHVHDADNLDLTTEGTLEAWIYLDDQDNRYAGIIHKGDKSDWSDEAYSLQFWDYNTLRLAIFDNSTYIALDSNSEIQTGEWYHVVGVWDSGNMYIYLNGKLDNYRTKSTSFNARVTNGGLNIGAQLTEIYNVTYGNFPLDGRIEEVRIWNMARTEAQIREDMHKTLNGSESGLVSYWQFNDDNSGIDAIDLVGDNNGTLTNMDIPTDWVISSVPTGDGISATRKPITGSSTVDFTGTNLTIDFNSNDVSDSIVVTKIEYSPLSPPAHDFPYNPPTGYDAIFDNQYWVVNRFGNGDFSANMTFSINEDLIAEDEINPARIALLTRDNNSFGNWELVANASVVNATTEEATFDSLTTFNKQFIIARLSIAEVCGNISSDTNWSSNLIKVTCDVIVDSGYTLTIDPGTIIQFYGQHKIEIRGTLLAEGTSDKRITFTSHPDSIGVGWKGVIFDSTSTVNDSSKITYCNIEYSKGNGGIFVKDFGKLLIDNCIISNNSADYGGGLAIYDNASPLVTNNIISNNTANFLGAGVMIYDNCNPKLVNNVIVNNTAGWHAAGILFHTNSGDSIINCTISNNHANSWHGGGIVCYSSSSPTFVNTIFSGNTITPDDTLGSQVYLSDTGSNPTFDSCILEGGVDDIWTPGRNGRSNDNIKKRLISARVGEYNVYLEIDFPNLSPSKRFVDIRKNIPRIDGKKTVSRTNSYENIIDSDPQFQNPTLGSGINYDGTSGDWSLQSHSPAISAGKDIGAPLIDKNGSNRIGTPDIGAFEYLGSNEQNGDLPDLIGFESNENISMGTVLNVIDGSMNIASLSISNGNGLASVTVEKYQSRFPKASRTLEIGNFWWNIDVTGNWTGDFTFFYDGLDLNGVQEESLCVYHWNGVEWENFGGTLDIDNNKIVLVGITSDQFSPFTLGKNNKPTPDNPLPIELKDFYAEVIPEGVMLHWATASELRNKGFYVYRDGERISDLIPGHGTTNESHEYRFLDENVEPDVLYTYKISDIEENTNIETFHPAITVMADGNIINPKNIPKVFALHSNYPNPFNPKTTIEFDLPKDGSLQLKIYDVTGKLVKTYADGEVWEAGYHSVVWDGKDERGKPLSSGMYFYRMVTDEFNKTNQMILLK